VPGPKPNLMAYRVLLTRSRVESREAHDRRTHPLITGVSQRFAAHAAGKSRTPPIGTTTKR
jgi:hypothetical protein